MGKFSLPSFGKKLPDTPDGKERYPGTQNNLSDGGHVYAVKDGDQYIWNFRGDPSFRLRPFDLSLPKLSPSMARNFPSRLLATQYEVVDLVGRESELRELASWASGPERVLVRVVHAVGGQGKTRLASQFARTLAASGWAVAEAFHTTSYKLGHEVPPASARKGSGLLVLVDYADRWPTSDLIALLAAHVYLSGPVRVLLIARGTGGWWQTLEDALLDVGIGDVDTFALPTLAAGLAHDGSDIAEAFQSAVAAFAPYLGLDSSVRVPTPENIGTLANEHALTLHMAALSATDAAARGVVIPSGQNLSKYLLNRERSGWNQLEQANRIKATARQIGHASFVAALTSAMSYGEGLQVVQATGIAAALPDADQVLADHKVAYPSNTVGTVLESMAPDRLAEDFIALSLLGAEEQGFNDAWAITALSKLLTPGEATQLKGPVAFPAFARRMVTTLVEAASRWPHVFTDTLRPLLGENPALAVAGGGTTVARLVELSRLDAAMLSLLAQHLPEGLDIEFDQASVLLAEYRLELSSMADLKDDPAEHISSLLSMGYRYSNIGRIKDAIEVTQKAVQILKLLVQEGTGDSDDYRTQLALALSNLGPMLMRSGKQPEALSASQAAVNVYNSIALPDTGDSETHLARVATAWSNHGAILSTVGDTSGALAATQKAVEIRRILADPNTGDVKAYGPGLAASLSNLGYQLPRENHAEALAATEEAVGVFRALASPVTGDPAAFRHELAGALINLGNRLSTVNKGGEAVKSLSESVDIYRDLADAETGNPDVYSPNLALSLVNFGATLSRMGRNKDAISLTKEAMRIYDSLINAGGPNNYRPEVARACNNLGHQLSEVGRLHEAVDATQKAVKIYGLLADAETGNPVAYGADLQLSTNNLKLQWSKLIS